MPPAARLSDLHTCPALLGLSAPIVAPCDPTVLIGFLPAARMGDAAACLVGTDPIILGSLTVLIRAQPAARMGDPTSLGGAISIGCPTVLIDMIPQVQALRAASVSGVPFCEVCNKAASGS